MDQLPAWKLLFWSFHDKTIRFGPARRAAVTRDPDNVPGIGPDSPYCRIVVIDLWQLLQRDAVGHKEIRHLFFAHDLMVRNHLVL